PVWYVTHYPDAGAPGIDPLLHYLTTGGAEGRDPGPNFSVAWYQTQCPDSIGSGIHPLVHYLTRGAVGSRDTQSIYEHTHRLPGWRPGYQEDLALLQHSGLFDLSWYLEQYPEVAEATDNPLLHFLTEGGREGRDPHPLFDSSWYLEQYPDIAHATGNP